jgi:hypothetical protein
MALSAAQVKPKIELDPSGSSSYADTTLKVGVVKSMSPSSSTESVKEKGIGGIVKKRLSKQEFKWGWSGFITDKNILYAGLPLDDGLPLPMDIYMHTRKLSGARTATMTISAAEGEPLKYDLEGLFLSHASAAEQTYEEPAAMFVYSDGAFYIGNTTAVDDESPSGSGTSYTTAHQNIEPGTVIITADAATITDNGKGALSDGGTINYLTGAITLNASATTVTLDYNYYGEQGTVKSFQLKVSRTITFVYGTSLAPTDLDIGATEYDGTIVVAADDFEEAMSGAIDADTPDFAFILQFTNSISGKTLQIIGTGAQFNNADGSIDPESSLEVSKGIDFEDMNVA